MQINKDVKAWMAPNKLFTYILEKYFRKNLPIPPEIYLSVLENKPSYILRQVAKNCHYSQIVDALVNDFDAEVSYEALQNEYWKLLGQYRPLLNLSRDEKIRFIHREGFPSIMVFVVYETDINVLKELFQNPNISVQMLNSLRHFLSARRGQLEIEPLLELIQSVIAVRRRRIFQVSAVFKEAKQEDPSRSISKILSFLLDEDDVVVKSAINVLKKYDYAVLREFVLQKNPFKDRTPDTEKIWLLLQRLQKYYRLPSPGFVSKSNSPLTISQTQQSYLEDIYNRKIDLLNYCAENLQCAQNMLTIGHAFLDHDDRVRKKLASILNFEEILSLINDSSFPQAISYRMINILKFHPSANIQKRISEVFLEINERTRKRIHEMELTINAYFDIIFNSLGYPSIHKIRQAFKILDSAKKLTFGFMDKSSDKDLDFDQVFVLFGKIAEFYQNEISEIYFDLAQNRISELSEVYKIILTISSLPEEYVKQEGYSEEENFIYFNQMYKRARTIWRSTLGQYLGRLRELDEMLRWKWLHRISDKAERSKLHNEMKTVMQNLEDQYKSEFKCRINQECRTCRKRSCASERYLRQIEFFLGELLDFVNNEDDDIPNSEHEIIEPEILYEVS